MTIVEAIKVVLSQAPNGLTSKEIYVQIVKQNLYTFGAKDPISVVNGQIRKRCLGLDFPTAHPVKIFKIVGRQNNKNKFALFDQTLPQVQPLTYECVKNTAEELPEERIGSAIKEHIASIRQQVLDCISNNSPEFFEQLVLDLLLKMGYGYGKQAGVVTGQPHDGGIDGIISEDKLGLDLIYIQAKRYAPKNKVGRKEIQAFIGAMEHIQKGVFITTSEFTKEALEFANKQQQKSIKLVDGEFLAELLVRYEVGVLPAQNVKIYKIDSDYFGI